MGKVHILECPFMIAGLSALSALIADTFWLIFDTLIKTKEFYAHPIAYGFVLGGLIMAIFLLIACMVQYKRKGLAKHELKIMSKNTNNTCNN